MFNFEEYIWRGILISWTMTRKDWATLQKKATKKALEFIAENFLFLLNEVFFLCNILFIYFIFVLGGGTLWHLQEFLWHLQEFLQCIKYIIPLSLIPPPPITGIVSTGIIFAFTYMCSQYMHCIHLLTLFLFPSPFYWYPLPHQTCPALLLFNFVE
jgi:hypothetical protein